MTGDARHDLARTPRDAWRYWARRLAIPGLILLAAGVVLGSRAGHIDPHGDGEYGVLAFLSRHRPGWSTTLDKVVEFIDGPLVTPWILLGMGVILFLLRRRMMALISILMTGMGWLPGHIVKHLWSRHRPPADLHPVVVYHDTMSYPSGHTGFITALVVFVWFALTMWRRPRGWLAVVGPLLIVLVAFTRLHAAAHYPLDVLGGFLLASGASLLLWGPMAWLWQRSQEWRFFAEPR